MTLIAEKMICAECGAEMNHHAMKIDYRTEDLEVVEVHTCPKCGHIDLRSLLPIRDTLG
jgi:DNA-directed RNA polymerase subunit RPC12/RpoP